MKLDECYLPKLGMLAEGCAREAGALRGLECAGGRAGVRRAGGAVKKLDL